MTLVFFLSSSKLRKVKSKLNNSPPQYYDPADEPIAEEPFRLEMELDDLPKVCWLLILALVSIPATVWASVGTAYHGSIRVSP